MANIFVFDIETIPDVTAGRRLLGLNDLPDDQVAEAMFAQQRAHNGSDFLRHHLHRICAISVVLKAHGQPIKVWSLGDPESGEKELLARFFHGVDKFKPTLVSWNGGGFDLPVIHYRSLLHGVSAPTYWENGSNDTSFRYNNYLSRYHERHTDLMDVLAMYQPRANAPLDEVAAMCGFPGKMGMSGAKVWDAWQQGELGAIRDYCETDVLNTYLVYLRYELMRGNMTAEGFQEECESVYQVLEQSDKPHLHEFLSHWEPFD